MNERQGIDVGRVMSIVGSRWKTVLAITLVAASAAYAYVTFFASPVYEATALVTYQSPSRDNPTGGALPSSGITREDISTLVANATTTTVVDVAAAELNMEPDQLRAAVQVRPNGEASIVAVVAKAGTPKEAAERANAWANAFKAERLAAAKLPLDSSVSQKAADLKGYGKRNNNPNDPNLVARNNAETALSAAKSQRSLWLSALSVSNPAREPDAAIWPKKSLTLLAALVIGFGLGSGVALLTARVDNRLHGDEYDALPAPVLVRVPQSPRAPKGTPLGPANAEPIVADSFAGLGARVMLDRFGDGAHVILVTSARSGEGKSSVAANLASALALGGRRVVLVDADMRRPTQDQVFPMLQNRPGLSQVLTRGAELESALTLVAPNLAAISSGPRHTNASVLLASVAFRQTLDRLSQISEVIVIDAPPVLAVNDALAVAPGANQVLLVARIGTSDLNEINEAHTRLASAAQTPQAMVLVGTERPQGYGYDQELRGNGRVAMPGPAPQAQPQPQAGPAGATPIRPVAAAPTPGQGHQPGPTPLPLPQQATPPPYAQPEQRPGGAVA
ncbi:MAG: tyrosine protein kinase [Thermoleophilia bacterium]|nr:tyrosine protein kinase [Thermoleophilia bacterium]